MGRQQHSYIRNRSWVDKRLTKGFIDTDFNHIEYKNKTFSALWFAISSAVIPKTGPRGRHDHPSQSGSQYYIAHLIDWPIYIYNIYYIYAIIQPPSDIK